MSLSKKAVMALSVVNEKDSIRAILTWPVFSFTSFLMLSKLKKQGLEPRTIIDVGANVGQFSVAAAKTYDDIHIYSFEPNPESVAKMRQNVKGLKQIQIFPVALGYEKGEADFHVNAHSHSSSLLPLAKGHLDAFPEAFEKQTIKVNVCTLDEISPELELERPVLLKLDVQGFEAAVLSGATQTLKSVDYILVETSFKPLYKGEVLFSQIMEMLNSHHFVFSRPVDSFSDDKTGEILQMDALFVRNSMVKG